MLFPLLVLIRTATRLAADRREERFAALRLVGGTPADIRVIASVESVVSAFCGAVLGSAVFLLERPTLAAAAPLGPRYFPGTVTPTWWGYLGMLAGVPVVAALAALLSLRRCRSRRLAPSRRATRKPPGFWRLTTLALGVGLYVYGLSKTTRDSIGAPAYPGLLVTMAGLVIAGPWITSAISRLFGRLSRRIVGTAGKQAPGRRPEHGVPRGDRARARGLPRHDGGRDRPRGQLDRSDHGERGTQQRAG